MNFHNACTVSMVRELLFSMNFLMIWHYQNYLLFHNFRSHFKVFAHGSHAPHSFWACWPEVAHGDDHAFIFILLDAGSFSRSVTGRAENFFTIFFYEAVPIKGLLK